MIGLSWNNTNSHSGENKLSYKRLTGIRELVKNAVLLDSEVHKHHSNNADNDLIIFDHKFYSLGQHDNEISLYKITVEEYYQDKKHNEQKRFHNLKYIKKVADVSADALAEKFRSGGSATSATVCIVSDLFLFVKYSWNLFTINYYLLLPKIG